MVTRSESVWLGNSDDVGLKAAATSGRSIEIAQHLLEEDIGESVEIVGRVIWPSPELPGLIGEWSTRYEPDVVMLKINGYWYLHPSVPLLLERTLGRLVGRSIATTGQRTADIPWLAHTRAYHSIRRIARRTVGSSTYFSPEEIVNLATRCVRTTLRREQVGIVVWSPLGAWEGAPAGAAEHVYAALEDLCTHLGLLHVAWQPGTPDPTIHMFHTGDRIHRSDEGHYWYGAREARAIRSAWKSAITGTPAPQFALDE